MTSNKIILITGATGHIGFRILIFALEAGYHVRAAVRSPEKSEPILNNPTLKALNLPPSVLTFTTVPDLETPGAYDEAVKGVTYIIHVASPIPSNNLTRSPSEAEEIFIRPAVQGTLSMLSAAKKEPSVRRVVITSSVVALIPLKYWGGMAPVPSDTVFSASSRMPLPPAPYPSLMAAYCASKTASFNESEAWVKREKPGYSVVNVHPGFVLGPDFLKLTAKDARAGTNMMALGLAFGAKNEAPRAGSAVHVDDVARVHVGALDEEKVHVSGGLRSFVANAPATWQRVVEIVNEEYKGAVEKGVLKGDGAQPTAQIPIDASETEEVFGFRFTSFDDQVRSVVGRFLELAEAA